MADVIKVVQGDELPIIELTLTDDVTNAAIDLSAASTTIAVRFRAVGGTTLLSTINCSKATTGADGKVLFDFQGGVLDVDPGEYEGEIVINFNGSYQTVYDRLRFRVRESLA